jgi:hypothetical protein
LNCCIAGIIVIYLQDNKYNLLALTKGMVLKKKPLDKRGKLIQKGK